MENYREFIDALNTAIDEAQSLPLGGFPPCPRPQPSDDAPRALILSPHPDDECVIGALPLRLLREGGMNVVNVAVTQGSRKDRQDARYEELVEACRFLGFGLAQTRRGGLEHIKLETRDAQPDFWRECVERIAGIIAEHRPAILFLPHAEDWNGTHIGTHHLVMDALNAIGSGYSCLLIETEYWQPMSNPNLMVECGTDLLADLIAGLTFHKGEVARNPYHLSLPAWMQDNVRRGSEVVGGQGGAGADFRFGTLYRASHWHNGTATLASPESPLIGKDVSAGTLLSLC